MEIQQARVHADLAPHLPALRSAVDNAVSDYWNAYSDAVRRIHTKRSVASLVHDHIVHNLAAFAETADGVELIQSQKLWLLSFDAGYLLRFKKVGSTKISAGHRTGQVKKFRNQMKLDGIESSVNLDLSYELDDGRKLIAVYLICPSGDYSNMWDSKLEQDAARPVVVSLFGEPTEPQGAKLLPKKRDASDEAQPGDGDSGA